MIIDQGLILADAEAVPNAGEGPGGITNTSEVLAFDLGTNHATAGIVHSDPSVSELELVIDVTTSFTTAEPTLLADVTVAFELISMPIPLANLRDCASGIGKDTFSDVTTTAATDTWDLVSNNVHSLAVGTPCFVDTLTTTTTPAVDTMMYVSAEALTTTAWEVTATRATALSGGTATIITTNGSALVQWFPFIHATTGGIPLSALQAGSRYVARVQPYNQQATTVNATQVGIGNAPYGSGKGIPTTAPAWQPVCNRYLALRCLVGAKWATAADSGTVGRFSANLVVNGATGERHFPTAVQVL